VICFWYNLAAEIHRLRSIKQETQERIAQRQTKRRLVERITVFEGKFQVDFKSGVCVDIEI